MSAEYFLNEMLFWEIRAYIDGLDRRRRPLWETMRESVWWNLRVQSTGDLPPMTELRPLPWDEADKASRNKVNEDELALMEKMRAEARAWNREHGQTD